MAAIGWAIGSQVQGRIYGRVPPGRLVELGGLIMSVGVAASVLSLVPGLSFWIITLTWLVAAGGMGLAFGSMGSLVLELSADDDRGSNVASLQVCDSVGSVVLVALAGAVYTTALAQGAVGSMTFAVMWLAMAGIAALGGLLARRIRAAPEA